MKTSDEIILKQAAALIKAKFPLVDDRIVIENGRIINVVEEECYDQGVAIGCYGNYRYDDKGPVTKDFTEALSAFKFIRAVMLGSQEIIYHAPGR